MGEGLKLVSEIFKLAQVQRGIPSNDVLCRHGINTAILVLSDPRNADLWQRMVDYCKQEEVTNA